MKQNRYKSPILWAAVIAQFSALTVLIMPQFEEPVKLIITFVSAVVAAFGAANNPTDHNGF